jgi:predicted enzyme related to lactoylglutathione lyase
MRKIQIYTIIVWLGMAALLAACSGATTMDRGFSLSAEPLTGKIIWHDLMTDDVAKAQAFYGALLGWSFEKVQRPNGVPYVLARAGQRFVAGMVEVADPGDGTEYSRWLGYLSVTNVDSAVRVAREMGGSVVLEPRQVGKIGQAAVILDSQGAPIGLLHSDMGDPDDQADGSPGTVGWNELLADDAASASAFYARLAGYEVRDIQRRNGVYYMLNDGIRDRAGVFTNPVEDTDPAWLTHFVVADIAAATASVAALGGRVLLGPSPEFREGRVALIMDPTGAVFMLQASER